MDWRTAQPLRERVQEKKSKGFGQRIALRNYGVIVLMLLAVPALWVARGYIKEDAERKQAELFGYALVTPTMVSVGVPAATPTGIPAVAVVSPVVTLNPAWPFAGYGWQRATITALAALPTPVELPWIFPPGSGSNQP